MPVFSVIELNTV